MGNDRRSFFPRLCRLLNPSSSNRRSIKSMTRDCGIPSSSKVCGTLGAKVRRSRAFVLGKADVVLQTLAIRLSAGRAGKFSRHPARPDHHSRQRALVKLSRFIGLAVLATVCTAAEQTAAQLFREAQKAEQAGQTVRAYLLYAQAAAKDPQNMPYWSRAQALRPIAVMAQPGIGPLGGARQETVEAKPASSSGIDPAIVGSISEWDIVDAKRHPLPPRELKAAPGLKDFDLKGDSKSLFEKVSSAFNLLTVFDSGYQPASNVRFLVTGVDYRDAVRLLQDATNSFVVPVADRLLLVANDNPQKRTELESTAVAVIPVPEPVTIQEVQQVE